MGAEYKSWKDPERKAFPVRGTPPGMDGMSGMTSSMLGPWLPSTADLIVSESGERDWFGRTLALARVKDERKSRVEDGSDAWWCTSWACCAISDGSIPSESCVEALAIFLTLLFRADWICRMDNCGTRADAVGKTTTTRSSIVAAAINAWQWSRGVIITIILGVCRNMGYRFQRPLSTQSGKGLFFIRHSYSAIAVQVHFVSLLSISRHGSP